MSELNDGFVEELRFIPDNEDDPKAFVQVATITNTSERIVRVVAKGLYSLKIEVMYLVMGQYKWEVETLNIGIEELESMAKVVAVYVKEKEKEEE